ncbi:hypothetical protein TRIP_D300142 [uncultured Paludibacter sp.]|uniref:Uncharacterized protein n=1 Tax=uncultured Paludibacter sp. TaxID=497635 RepID=A0A653AAZ6_9BACT|nr:hypothetical protein TRIP_D300142 [uncultured Paludibacter sp.]
MESKFLRATTKNGVVTKNDNIQADGHSEIFLKNLGDTPAQINDNIPLDPGDDFAFSFEKGIVIDEPLSIRFLNSGSIKKVLWIKTYFK